MTGATPSRWRVVRLALLAVLALVIVAVATQALWLAPLVSRRLAESSGREVRIERMWLGVSSSLAPALHMKGIRIANAPWADTDRPFVALGSATALFSWRSIEERRPVVALWMIADGEVDLEREADGLRNWRLGNPDYRGPGRWKVLAVSGERATLRFRHAGLDVDLRATTSAAVAADASSSAAARSSHLDLSGRWRQLPFAVSADTGPVVTLLETGATFPIRGRLEAGGATLELDGALGDIIRRPIADGHVVVAMPSLAPFSAFIVSRQREARAIRIEGTVKVGDGQYAISGAKGRIGSTDLAGDASWVRTDERNAIVATLASESTDVADLRWLASHAPPRVKAEAAARPGPSPSASAASERLGRGEGRELDVKLSFAARKLRAAELPALQSGRIDATLSGGRLTVSRFDIGVAQGHVDGHATLELHDAPMRAEAELHVRGVRVEPFVGSGEGKSRVTGALQGDARLKAQGNSADAWRETASGRITAALVGGTISSRLDAEMGLQIGKVVRSFIGGAEAIPIRCAVAVVDVERGAGKVRRLVIDTERTRTVGTGSIDAAARSIDLVLTPQAKQAGLLDLERSIRIHGPLAHPARQLVARAAAPVASAGPCGDS